jgi:riboflavin biosynthesis pyrimidine reductase
VARVITSFVRQQFADLFIITISPQFVGGLPALDAGAASIVALNEMVDRLAEDHANSRRFAKGLIMMNHPAVSCEVSL